MGGINQQTLFPSAKGSNRAQRVQTGWQTSSSDTTLHSVHSLEVDQMEFTIFGNAIGINYINKDNAQNYTL